MVIRHALTELGLWYSKTNRKPLVLRGARQVQYHLPVIES